MKKKSAPVKRKPAAMVRISPAVHKAMRKHVEANGLIQAQFVDRAITAAISGKG